MNWKLLLLTTAAMGAGFLAGVSVFSSFSPQDRMVGKFLHQNVTGATPSNYTQEISKKLDSTTSPPAADSATKPPAADPRDPAAPLFFVGIKSAPHKQYRARRDEWRQSRCSSDYRNASIKYLFFIGKPITRNHDLSGHNQGGHDTVEEQELQQALYEEQKQFGDIYMVPMRDAYEDVSNKMIAVWTYGLLQTSAPYIIDHDDEFCLSAEQAKLVVQQHEANYPSQELYAGGYLWEGTHEGSWGPHGERAPYFSGNLLIMSRGLVHHIIQSDHTHTILNGIYGSYAADANLGKWVKFAAESHNITVHFATQHGLLWSVETPK